MGRTSKYIDPSEAREHYTVWASAPRSTPGRRAEQALIHAVEPIRQFLVDRWTEKLQHYGELIVEEIHSSSWEGVAKTLATWDPERAQLPTWSQRQIDFAIRNSLRKQGLLSKAHKGQKWFLHSRVPGRDLD